MEHYYQYAFSNGMPGPIYLLEEFVIDLESPVSTAPSTPTSEAFDVDSDADDVNEASSAVNGPPFKPPMEVMSLQRTLVNQMVDAIQSASRVQIPQQAWEDEWYLRDYLQHYPAKLADVKALVPTLLSHGI